MPDTVVWIVRFAGVIGAVWAVLGPIVTYRLLKRRSTTGAVSKRTLALSIVEVEVYAALGVLAAYDTLATSALLSSLALIGCLALVIMGGVLRFVIPWLSNGAS